jgi:NAD-dependent deacetylase
VILTGAGLSAESGLGTFRDAGGVWTKVRLEDVATPEAFAADPDHVRAFYDARRIAARAAAPNPAHVALARLEAAREDVTIVTQNVDALLERAGARRVIHIHGALDDALCDRCGHRWAWAPDTMTAEDRCPACDAAGGVRPDVVWFGEMPYRMDEVYDLLESAALFVSIGTSGAVYPAAGFVHAAAGAGARTLELNLEPSAGSDWFDETRLGKASELVPAWVETLIGNS